MHIRTSIFLNSRWFQSSTGWPPYGRSWNICSSWATLPNKQLECCSLMFQSNNLSLIKPAEVIPIEKEVDWTSLQNVWIKISLGVEHNWTGRHNFFWWNFFAGKIMEIGRQPPVPNPSSFYFSGVWGPRNPSLKKWENLPINYPPQHMFKYSPDRSFLLCILRHLYPLTPPLYPFVWSVACDHPENILLEQFRPPWFFQAGVLFLLTTYSRANFNQLWAHLARK